MKTHCDHVRDIFEGERKGIPIFSIIGLLNEDYEGGDFAFWGGRHKIKLGVGDVMIWPADYFWVHEVEEITKGTRYSANTFLCRHPFEMPEEVKYNIKQVEHQPFWKAIKSRR